MFKKLLIAITTLSLTGQTSQAMTSSEDIVGVHLYNGIMAKDQKKYFKKWKQLNLSAKTRSALLQKNQLIDKQEGYGIERFKIHFLFVGEGEVTRVFFLGDGGTVIMMDWPKGQYCKMLFDGDAGFAASIDENCTRLN